MKCLINVCIFICCLCCSTAHACHPTLSCVSDNGDGTHTAFFGFVGGETIKIGNNSGSDNYFFPGFEDRGQGTVFPGSGAGKNRFQPPSLAANETTLGVTFSSNSSVSWRLGSTTVTATKNSPTCQCAGNPFTATFSENGRSVSVTSSKDLSHVNLTFCDGSTYKFDNLSQGSTGNFSLSNKEIKGVYVKAGCSGQSFERECNVDCAGVPGGNATVDACDVCGGDGSSCADCKGVPNGTNTTDQCGVCDSDSSNDNVTCVGCDGTPNSNLLVDECGVCGGDSTSCADCHGVPNGTATIDQCGVCGGQNNTCLDCAGTPNGEAQVDQCGVCGGDGTSCLDCAGVANGSNRLDFCKVCDADPSNDNATCTDCAGQAGGNAVVDACGVCGGDGSSCADCAGTSNGNATLDMCGTCNGNNACTDCAGIPNGGTLVDTCGVCGGDGTSCTRRCPLTKINVDIPGVVSLAKELYSRTVPYLERARKCDSRLTKVTRRGNRLAERTLSQYLSVVKQLKLQVELCPGECIQLVNKKQLSTLKRLSKFLYKQAGDAQRGAAKACKTQKGSKLTVRVQNALDQAIEDCPNQVCNK